MGELSSSGSCRYPADHSLPFYQDKLHEPTLYSRFQEILQKVCRTELSHIKP